jgi:predicted transcriptional regulator
LTPRASEPTKQKIPPSKLHEGKIMTIAKSSVVTASLMTSVYDVVNIMAKNGFRRIPIVVPETKKLQGIVTSTDIVNYLGGGHKFRLVHQKFKGSFFKAINEPHHPLRLPLL